MDSASSCSSRKKRRKKQSSKKPAAVNSVAELLNDVELDASKAQESISALSNDNNREGDSASICSGRKKGRKKRSSTKLTAVNSVADFELDASNKDASKAQEAIIALSNANREEDSASICSSRKKGRKKRSSKKLAAANSITKLHNGVELDASKAQGTRSSLSNANNSREDDDSASNCSSRKKGRKKRWRKKLEAANSVTELLGDIELDASKVQEAISALRKANKEEDRMDTDFAPVMVSYENVALIVSELEVSEEVAEQVLREVALEGAREEGKMLEAALRKLVTT